MTPRQRNTGLIATAITAVIFILPFFFVFSMTMKTKKGAALFLFSWPAERHFWANLKDVIKARNCMLLLAYFNSTAITGGAVALLIIFASMV